MRFLAALALIACSSSPDPTPITSKPTPLKSPLGDPIGDPIVQSLDASGGSVVGHGATLNVPAGALSEPTGVFLQPRVDTMPVGIGDGVEVVGAGPGSTITMGYPDDEDPSTLGLAAQAEDHSWYALRPITIDTAAHTLTAQVVDPPAPNALTGLGPHVIVVFSPGARIQGAGSVEVKKTDDLTLGQAALDPACTVSEACPLVTAPTPAGTWSVDTGTIVPTGQKAVYNAPDEVPASGSATVRFGEVEKRIRITGDSASGFTKFLVLESASGTVSDMLTVVTFDTQGDVDETWTTTDSKVTIQAGTCVVECVSDVTFEPDGQRPGSGTYVFHLAAPVEWDQGPTTGSDVTALYNNTIALDAEPSTQALIGIAGFATSSDTDAIGNTSIQITRQVRSPDVLGPLDFESVPFDVPVGAVAAGEVSVSLSLMREEFTRKEGREMDTLTRSMDITLVFGLK